MSRPDPQQAKKWRHDQGGVASGSAAAAAAGLPSPPPALLVLAASSLPAAAALPLLLLALSFWGSSWGRRADASSNALCADVGPALAAGGRLAAAPGGMRHACSPAPACWMAARPAPAPPASWTGPERRAARTCSPSPLGSAAAHPSRCTHSRCRWCRETRLYRASSEFLTADNQRAAASPPHISDPAQLRLPLSALRACSWL